MFTRSHIHVLVHIDEKNPIKLKLNCVINNKLTLFMQKTESV